MATGQEVVQCCSMQNSMKFSKASLYFTRVDGASSLCMGLPNSSLQDPRGLLATDVENGDAAASRAKAQNLQNCK